MKIEPSGFFAIKTQIPPGMVVNGWTAAILATVEKRGVAYFKKKKVRRPTFDYDNTVEQLKQIMELNASYIMVDLDDNSHYVINHDGVTEIGE